MVHMQVSRSGTLTTGSGVFERRLGMYVCYASTVLRRCVARRVAAYSIGFCSWDLTGCVARISFVNGWLHALRAVGVVRVSALFSC
jgi:hypothetical protein